MAHRASVKDTDAMIKRAADKRRQTALDARQKSRVAAHDAMRGNVNDLMQQQSMASFDSNMAQFQEGKLTDEQVIGYLHILIQKDENAVHMLLQKGIVPFLLGRVTNLAAFKMLETLLANASQNELEIYTEPCPKSVIDQLMGAMVLWGNEMQDPQALDMVLGVLIAVLALKRDDYNELVCNGIQPDRLQAHLMHESDDIKSKAVYLLRNKLLFFAPSAKEVKHFLPILAAGVMSDNVDLMLACADAFHALSLVAMEMDDDQDTDPQFNHVAEMVKSTQLIHRIVCLVAHPHELLACYSLKTISNMLYVCDNAQVCTMIDAGVMAMLKGAVTHHEDDFRAEAWYSLSNLAASDNPAIHDILLRDNVVYDAMQVASGHKNGAVVGASPIFVLKRAVCFLVNFLLCASNGRVEGVLTPEMANCISACMSLPRNDVVCHMIEATKRVLTIQVGFKEPLAKCGFFDRLAKFSVEHPSKSVRQSAGDVVSGNLNLRDPDEEEEDDDE